MIIDCISDLHGFYPEDPELLGGDLLIVAGDLTEIDTLSDHSDFINFLNKLNYKKKVLIAGNHDNFLQRNKNFYEESNITFLCDSATEFEYEEVVEEEHKFKGMISYNVKKKLKIWGSPWSLWFHGINPHCTAFTGSESDLKKKYDLIPEDTDILITHTPPYGILDHFNPPSSKLDFFGSSSLRIALEKIKPRLHVFGHIHEGHGKMILKHEGKDTICVNASIMDRVYDPINKPIRIEL